MQRIELLQTCAPMLCVIVAVMKTCDVDAKRHSPKGTSQSSWRTYSSRQGSLAPIGMLGQVEDATLKLPSQKLLHQSDLMRLYRCSQIHSSLCF